MEALFFFQKKVLKCSLYSNMYFYKICVQLTNLKKKKQFFIIKVLQIWSFKCGEKKRR